MNQQISDIESEKTNLKSHLEKIREDPERAMPVVVELISLERKLRELSNKVLQLQYESSEKMIALLANGRGLKVTVKLHPKSKGL